MNGLKRFLFTFSCISASIGLPECALSEVIDRSRDFAVHRIQTGEFTLVENGLHYLDSGHWRESQDLIELTADGGAAAMRAPHTVYFQPNLNTEEAVVINTVDNRVFRTHIVGLYYFDAATGKSALLAPVQDSIGELLPPNQLLYRSAFDGVNADVRFTCTKSAFETDVILLEQPPPPESFGLSSATSRLEVWHEFLDSPEPKKTEIVLKQESNPLLRQAMADPDWVEETLDFGDLWFPLGRSFLNKTSATKGDPAAIQVFSKPSDTNQVAVAKQWLRVDERKSLLIESADWRDLQPRMASLPKRLAALDPDILKLRAVCGRVIPDRLMAAASNGDVIKTASLPYYPRGYVWDYIVVSGSGSYTFNSGVTYWLQSGVTFSSITFQPGAVLKYATNAYLSAYSSITCPAAGTMQVVLTSVGENLFGESIGSGTPSYYDRALIVYGISSVTLQNLRVRWANIGPYFLYAQSCTLRDSRMQNCSTGVLAESSSTVTLSNDTACNVATPTLAVSGSTIAGTPANDCGPLYAMANFGGLTYQDCGISIPDTMGAVGPNHFMTTLNGNWTSMAVYNKYTGARLADGRAANLFDVTVSGGSYAGTYPAGDVFDPRIIYDHLSQRWIATAIDAVSKYILLAVSNGPDPVGNGGGTWVTDNWKKYLVPFGTSCNTDSDKLAADANAIYVYAETSAGCGNVAALPKAQFTNGTAQTVQTSFTFRGGVTRCFPAINFDSVAPSDPAWFVRSLAPSLQYNRLLWVNGLTNAPQFEVFPWNELTVTQSMAQVPQEGVAPQAGSDAKAIAIFGSAAMSAIVRNIGTNQYLWTCRQISVNRFGHNDDGLADRWGIEWFKIQTTPTVSLVDSGRIYDAATSNQKFYYMPSLAVNKRGDMLIGFSGSSVNDYIGAFYWGRTASGASPTNPVRYFDGKDWFGSTSFPSFRWGDYSHTTLDPDGLTMWTIQEYAETAASGDHYQFGTRIIAVTPF